MKRIILISVLILVSFTIPNIVYSSSAWEWNIMGITNKTIKSRDPVTFTTGIVTSLLVHEMGHIIAGNINNMNVHFDIPSMRTSIHATEYNNASNDQRALYHAGGFLAQILTGTILTAVPATRHHDFTIGFNSVTTIQTLAYTITGGVSSKYSDVHQLDINGYNGQAISAVSSFIAGNLTIINLGQ